eukprot:12793437-Alexandrium_andersonii.AAC.1
MGAPGSEHLRSGRQILNLRSEEPLGMVCRAPPIAVSRRRASCLEAAKGGLRPTSSVSLGSLRARLDASR